jgi:acid stress-induced BolA-like protein IbaG/YrbA
MTLSGDMVHFQSKVFSKTLRHTPKLRRERYDSIKAIIAETSHNSRA